MKWKKFKDEYPYLGTHVLISDGKEMISIIEFDLDCKKYLLEEQSQRGGDYLVSTFWDNPFEDCDQDIECFPYWCYPSDMRTH